MFHRSPSAIARAPNKVGVPGANEGFRRSRVYPHRQRRRKPPRPSKNFGAKNRSSTCSPQVLDTLNALCRSIPRGHVAVKIGMIRHVTGDRGVVSKYLVLDHMFASLDGVEEIRDVIGRIVVAMRSGV